MVEPSSRPSFPPSSPPGHKFCNKFAATGRIGIGSRPSSGGIAMRGRKPHPLTLAAADGPILRAVAHSRHLSFFQVERARIVLAVAAGEPIQAVASRLECDRATVWRVCRRYEQGGLKQLLLEEPR